MSLQDDFFDLESELKGDQKKKFMRIWHAFVDLERETEPLQTMRASLKRAIEAAYTSTVVVLFVGEERSATAKKMGVYWEDGNLAAKTLFDACRAHRVDPLKHEFTNLFERGGKRDVREWRGPVVAMGRKVQAELTRMGIEHTPMVHPAARGKIRLKANYAAHVGEVLREVGVIL